MRTAISLIACFFVAVFVASSQNGYYPHESILGLSFYSLYSNNNKKMEQLGFKQTNIRMARDSELVVTYVATKRVLYSNVAKITEVELVYSIATMWPTGYTVTVSGLSNDFSKFLKDLARHFEKYEPITVKQETLDDGEVLVAIVYYNIVVVLARAPGKSSSMLVMFAKLY